jgi:hypothetical protein
MYFSWERQSLDWRVLIRSREKINRDIQLIESSVSHSKQRPAHQINRNISRDPFACAHSGLHQSPITNHYSPLTKHPLRPASQSAKISRTTAQI